MCIKHLAWVPCTEVLSTFSNCFYQKHTLLEDRSMYNEMSPGTPSPCLLHLADTPAPQPMAAQGPAPGSLPILDSFPCALATSVLSGLVQSHQSQAQNSARWPITPRSPTTPNVWFCGSYWRIGGRRKIVRRGSDPAAFGSFSALLPLLLPFLFQSNKQIIPAQAPRALCNYSDLVIILVRLGLL